MGWAVGEVIVLREVLAGRIRSARPLSVLADGPEGLVGYLAPRSQVAWPRLADEAQSQTPDQGWRLPLEEWRGPGCLFVLPADEAFAVVRFLDRENGRPLGWKVDFLAPPRRHAAGLDTLDWALDLLVSPDLSTVTVKDLDDLAQLELVGLLGEGGGDGVRAARRRAEARIAARQAPFTGPWADWQPPVAGVAALALPEGWDRMADSPEPAGPSHRSGGGPAVRGSGASGPAVRGSGVGRSGVGTRLLDEAGRTLLDLDLAGGTLLHGHAHFRITEAVTRQVGLGLGAGTADGLPGVLAERLASRFPAVESVVWAGSGAEAWWAAVRAARRATGRRPVACWTPALPLGGDGPDADLVVLPGDLARALDLLDGAAEAWAALIVDPLLLAGAGEAGTAPGCRPWAGLAPGALIVADERRTLGAGPGGGHGRLGLVPDLVVLGPSLFGGLGGAALAGRTELVREAAGGTSMAGPAVELPGGPAAIGGQLHPVLAAAALATLDLATPAALADLASRAGQLRARLGTDDREGPVGLGAAVRLPPAATPARLHERGVLVNGSGWGWLATVSTDSDVDEAAAALAELG